LTAPLSLFNLSYVLDVIPMGMSQRALMAREVLYVKDYDTSSAVQRPYCKGTEIFPSSRAVITTTGVTQSIVISRG